jgi:hypothetical protein
VPLLPELSILMSATAHLMVLEGGVVGASVVVAKCEDMEDPL